jgi:hypothetical protein
VYDVGRLSQVPVAAVRVSAFLAVPLTVGRVRFVAMMSIAGPLAADNIGIDEPILFVAVTATFKNFPTSSGVTVYELEFAPSMFEYVPDAELARFH